MARNPNKRIMGNQKRFGPGTTSYMVELQGVNVLSDHFMGMALAAQDFFPQLLDVVGDIGVERARELVPVLTGDTYRSINSDPGVISKGQKGEWSIRYGPTTFYSPFLEYGTRFMSPRPFMIPSADLAEVVFIQSILAFLKLFDTNNAGRGFGAGNPVAGQALKDPRVQGSISGVRNLLYSQVKFLGDVSVFGGREFLGPIRGRMLFLAKGLGDVSSIMRGALNQRITRRLQGRAFGRLQGFGSASLSHSQSYSGFPGGEGGRRIYQRSVGRVSSIGLGRLSSFEFGG